MTHPPNGKTMDEMEKLTKEWVKGWNEAVQMCWEIVSDSIPEACVAEREYYRTLFENQLRGRKSRQSCMLKQVDCMPGEQAPMDCDHGMKGYDCMDCYELFHDHSPKLPEKQLSENGVKHPNTPESMGEDEPK